MYVYFEHYKCDVYIYILAHFNGCCTRKKNPFNACISSSRCLSLTLDSNSQKVKLRLHNFNEKKVIL